ncbi:MAG: inorganic phosphate transporter [Armatimonadota bacterium]
MLLLIIIILLALAFDFINGFHDAANSIATVVATKVLTPLRAVAWAASFNFIAALLFPTHVAATIGKDVIHAKVIDPHVILCALIGAIVWDLITWIAGLPTSSSHALVGGLLGAALGRKWSASVLCTGGILKIVLFIFLAPVIGLVLGLIFMTAISWIFRSCPPGRVNRYFRHAQFFSAGSYSLGHGLNDAQKTMGIIWMLLIATGHASPITLPFWVKIACCVAIAAGTMSGGWRIVKTMGLGLTKLQPPGAFSAELSGAITLIGVSCFGIPVSTTHTITGAIVGVGSTKRLSAVRWGVASRIVWAWILTIPMAALIGWLAYHCMHLFM